MKKYQTFIKTVLLLLLVGLLLTIGIQVVIDPLFQYHMPLFGLKPVMTDERYQNAGIAKNFDYDSAIIGNSMSQNFRISDVEDVFGGKVVKLTFSGSSFLDWSYDLNIITERKDMELSNALINIDPLVLGADSKQLRHELPLYLYDNNVFNDVEYHLSFEMLSRFTLDMLRENSFDYNSVYAWDSAYPCGKENVLRKYTRPELSFESPDIEGYLSNLMMNLDLFSKYVKSMKNTHFVFFFSPFSMAYWDTETRENKVELQKQSFLLACDYLLSFDNVTVFLWADDEMLDVMSDLDNYKDYTHYGADVSKMILKRVKENTGVLNKENYQLEIDKLFDYIEAFQYDSLFE